MTPNPAASVASDGGPISVKDPQAARAVRRLAKATGEPLTDAVRIAAEERYDRLFPAQAHRAKRLEAFIARSRERAILDHRDAEEILGYDDEGLPR